MIPAPTEYCKVLLKPRIENKVMFDQNQGTKTNGATEGRSKYLNNLMKDISNNFAIK